VVEQVSFKTSLGRTFLFILIVTLLLWPRYIVFKVDPLPGVRVDRIFLSLSILIYFVYFLFSKRPLSKLKKYKMFVLLLTTLSFVFFISFLNNIPNLKSFYAYVNFLVTGPFLAIYCITFIDDKEHIEKVLELMVLVFLVMNIIALFEFFVEHPLFDKFLITKKNIMWAVRPHYREGKYRVQSLFPNPLVYAQVLVALIPINWYFFKGKKTNFIFKILVFFNLFLSIIMVFLTDSRAGIGLVCLMPFLVLYEKTSNKIFKLMIKMIGFFVFILIFFKLVVIVKEIPFDFVKKLAIEGANKRTLSLYYRFVQLKFAIICFMKKPFLGFGYGNVQYIIKPFLKSMDNYVLTLIISGGILGLVSFFAVVFYGLNFSINKIDKTIRDLSLYVKVSAINLLLFYLILSIDLNNSLLFVLLAILVIIKKNYSKGFK